MARKLRIKLGHILILQCFYFMDTYGQCNKSNHFGPDCDFVCHCMDDKQCDTRTGQCPYGCDYDWVGPGCQRKNIAREENGTIVRQASNRKPAYGPNLAIDKDLHSCSKTKLAGKSTVIPWWRIWLPHQHRIKNITINGWKKYFQGLKVMVENVTYDKRKSNKQFNPITCYQHGNSESNSTQINVTCDNMIVGNQIRIKLAKRNLVLGLCDVRIYGECDYGTYGISCTEKCSPYCKTACGKDDGTCDECLPGWKGNRCDQECGGMTYGVQCTEKCSPHCQDVCNKDDGSCVSCEPGWKGNRCDQECEDGMYGINCAFPCSPNCINSTVCSKKNGNCTQGCEADYLGYLCNEECEDGMNGINCSFPCNPNCTNSTVCSKKDGKCTQGCEAGYLGYLCNEKQYLEDTSPAAGIAGGICGAVVVAFIIAALVIFVKRKQEKRHVFMWGPYAAYLGMAYENTDTQNEDVFFNNISASSIDLKSVNETSNRSQDHTDHKRTDKDMEEESFYYNNQSEHEVILSELETYVKNGLADKEYFIKQFQQIPHGMKYPSNVAKRSGNLDKNRYKSVHAYDHSRVVLKRRAGQPDSDYINATRIKGHSFDNAYIAAQAPTESTLADFWRMIWENNIQTIVMATKLFEDGKLLYLKIISIKVYIHNDKRWNTGEYLKRFYNCLKSQTTMCHVWMKCLQYWPTAENSEQYGKVIVVTETEDVFAEFTVRHFTVSQETRPARKRIVTQFHYTAWPDKDVPRSTSSLLDFWYKVRKHDERKTRPWLVHCSAGVGRTGTFIALDILYDQGKDSGSVNIFKCVDDLRGQRVSMVQTKEQYKYLHSIIAEALVLPSQPVLTEMFHSIYNDLEKIDPQTKKTKLLLQYETLICNSWTVSRKQSDADMFTSAKNTENKHKNRYDKILAPNEFRPFLQTQVSGCTDYINAVFIPGYRNKYGYIIAQTPLKYTAIDCCRLVYEQNIQTIVTFQENGGDDVGIYLPESKYIQVGPFTLTFVAEEDKMHCIKRDYQLSYRSEKRSVTQLIFKNWTPSGSSPSDPGEMLLFLEELQDMQRCNDNKPILTQCLNGAERSGLVVVLMNILERLRFDNEVSIPLLIRQLKIRREQIIPNYEQFKFCHDVVLCHIEKNATYANI